MSKKTFESTDKPLEEILRKIGNATIQLPEFQRGWVWDDNHIKSLLASISLSFPIGAVMMLQSSDEIKLKPRLIEGVQKTEKKPELLILDGQQRLTSLFQSLVMNKAVDTLDDKDNKIKRWYYIDMKKALNEATDREDAILSVPENKKITKSNVIIEDYSLPMSEYEKEVFPLTKVFDYKDWRREYEKYWNHKEEKTRFLIALRRRYWNHLMIISFLK